MANPFERVSLADLRERTSIKWRFFEPDVLPMWVAEMDVMPAEAGDACRLRRDGPRRHRLPVRHRLRGGVRAVRRRPVGRAARRAAHRARLRRDDGRVRADPDADPAERLGDRRRARSTRRSTPTRRTRSARSSRRRWARTCGSTSPRSRRPAPACGAAGAVLLLCNPHNPTGTVHTRAELERARADRRPPRRARDRRRGACPAAVRRRVHALLDRATRAASRSRARRRRGTSPGCAPRSSSAAPRRARTSTASPRSSATAPRTSASIAHIAAFDDGRAWLDDVLEGLRGNRALLARLLAEHAPTIRWQPGEATFLAWLDCRGHPRRRPRLAGGRRVTWGSPPARPRRSSSRHRVGLNAGEAFGSGGENHVRFNLGTRPDVIEEAVRRMGAIA